MKNQLFPAPEVAAIGEQLIRQHHDNLRIRDWRTQKPARIDYLFCAETPARLGKEIWGSARGAAPARFRAPPLSLATIKTSIGRRD